MVQRREDNPLYKIITCDVWRDLDTAKFIPWSKDDLADGFMHLSTSAQVLQTAERHFSAEASLIALEIDRRAIAGAIKFEPARNGQMFPHLYGQAPIEAVVTAHRLTRSAGGRFAFDPNGDEG